MIKAVIIGCAHMHVNEVALYIHEESEMSLEAFADLKAETSELTQTRYTRAWNIENVRSSYCGNYYDDYKDMLDKIKPEIAFILCETYKKPEVVEECAKRGVNVSIEKPLAVSLSEAMKIKRLVNMYNIEAVVNWPLTWRPHLHKMKNAVDEGLIGNLIKVNFLIGNTGPVGKGAIHRGVAGAAEEMTDLQKSKMWWYQDKCGGGAVLDFCCYGCMLSNWIIRGNAKSVTAVGVNVATDFADICDNGIAIVKYPGAVAVLEGTWTTPSRAIPSGPVLYGDTGVIYCEREENEVRVKAFDIYGKDISVPETEVPKHLKNIAAEYVYHKRTGERVHETLSFDFNMSTMAILDAAVRSVGSHKEEIVGDVVWRRQLL